ncbi:D-alanyl-D-alanine carboxypeptidase [Streptomyces sp. NPDC059861]|uniref:D-alanyl-D-alanine carboxypeptidase n=1 Tax=Streptomyces sp. NPDC059861 TaxID=3346974 RepID=UPI00364C1E60
MEEASVAGESPDSSKQRESSAEPTSGSASPVPEARSGATARDPRLAVARESENGRPDTATRVLSVKERSEEATQGAAEETASETPSGDAASEERAGRAEREGAEGDAGSGDSGDDRLRAAVAAWVTSGPGEEGSADASAGKAEGDGTEGAADDTHADAEEARRSAEADAKGANDGAQDAREDAEGDSQDARRGTSDDAEDAPHGSPEDTDDAPHDAAGGTTDALDAANGARDDAKGDTTPTATADAKDTTEGDAGDSRADAEDAQHSARADAEDAPHAVNRARADANDAPHGADQARDDAKGGTAPAAEGEGEHGGSKADAPHAADRARDDAKGGTAPAAEGEGERGGSKDTGGAVQNPRGGSQDEAKGDPRLAAEGTAEGGPRTDARPGSTPGAKGDSKSAPGDSRADARPDAEGDRGGAERTPAAAPDAKDGRAGAKSSPAEAPKADAPPGDQPTAVFRAVKPAVDQPTTMLKLGDARKPAPKPESEAERTSKFVALKPLDDPSTRKPPPAADATTALPRVPSDRPKAPADETAFVPQVGPERTTQQPLPPKPPLDLLAELTNTPPPPQTPLRTAARRVKIWTPLVLLLVVAFAVAQAVRPLPAPTLELTAKESYSFEGDDVALPWPSEGQGAMDVAGIGTMGGFGEQKPVAIGSVAKAMTAYVILKEHPLKAGQEGPEIEVDATAEKEGGYDQQGNESTLNTVKKGDKLTERQALSAIMIPSANNIARLVARWDSGSEEAFVKKMNDTAKELGMTDTTYTDPSGLKETTVSTAADQVKLGNELVRIPALVEITKLPEWVDPSGQKWRNWNTLVPYDGAIGIKTGTTSAAGGNLLFAATKEVGGETVTVVGAILGQHTAPIIDTVNAVSRTAMLGAQEALASAKILKRGDVVGYVDDRLGGRTPVVVTQDVTAVGWAGHKVELSFTADDVPHTARTGTKVGTLTVGDGSGGAVDVPVALQSDLAEPAFLDKLTRVA